MKCFYIYKVVLKLVDFMSLNYDSNNHINNRIPIYMQSAPQNAHQSAIRNTYLPAYNQEKDNYSNSNSNQTVPIVAALSSGAILAAAAILNIKNPSAAKKVISNTEKGAGDAFKSVFKKKSASTIPNSTTNSTQKPKKVKTKKQKQKQIQRTKQVNAKPTGGIRPDKSKGESWIGNTCAYGTYYLLAPITIPADLIIKHRSSIGKSFKNIFKKKRKAPAQTQTAPIAGTKKPKNFLGKTVKVIFWPATQLGKGATYLAKKSENLFFKGIVKGQNALNYSDNVITSAEKGTGKFFNNIGTGIKNLFTSKPKAPRTKTRKTPKVQGESFWSKFKNKKKTVQQAESTPKPEKEGFTTRIKRKMAEKAEKRKTAKQNALAEETAKIDAAKANYAQNLKEAETRLATAKETWSKGYQELIEKLNKIDTEIAVISKSESEAKKALQLAEEMQIKSRSINNTANIKKYDDLVNKMQKEYEAINAELTAKTLQRERNKAELIPIHRELKSAEKALKSLTSNTPTKKEGIISRIRRNKTEKVAKKAETAQLNAEAAERAELARLEADAAKRAEIARLEAEAAKKVTHETPPVTPKPVAQNPANIFAEYGSQDNYLKAVSAKRIDAFCQEYPTVKRDALFPKHTRFGIDAQRYKNADYNVLDELHSLISKTAIEEKSIIMSNIQYLPEFLTARPLGTEFLSSKQMYNLLKTKDCKDIVANLNLLNGSKITCNLAEFSGTNWTNLRKTNAFTNNALFQDFGTIFTKNSDFVKLSQIENVGEIEWIKFTDGLIARNKGSITEAEFSKLAAELKSAAKKVETAKPVSNTSKVTENSKPAVNTKNVMNESIKTRSDGTVDYIAKLDANGKKQEVNFYRQDGKTIEQIQKYNSKEICTEAHFYREDGKTLASIRKYDNVIDGKILEAHFYNADGKTLSSINKYSDVVNHRLLETSFYRENGTLSKIYKYDASTGKIAETHFFKDDGTLLNVIKETSANFEKKTMTCDTMTSHTGFIADRIKPNNKDGIYIIEQISENQAILKLNPSEKTQTRIFGAIEDILQPACEDITPVRGATKMIMKKPGQLELINGEWTLKEKMAIELQK